METLKLMCPTCKGNRVINTHVSKQEGKIVGKTIECPACEAKGYTDPPQHILDAIECDRIERKLLEKFKDKEVFVYYEFGHWNAAIPSKTVGYKKYFEGKTKLEALQKAEEFVDGR
jgi:hypothetical protein